MPGPPPLILAASVGAVGGAVPPISPLVPPATHLTPSAAPLGSLLHYSFPSEADTLAYVDALKHSDLSDWRSLQEVSCETCIVTSNAVTGNDVA